jgi:hypothetical protein
MEKTAIRMVAALVVAIGAVALPRPAAAVNCDGDYFLCLVETGGFGVSDLDRDCLGEYWTCLMTRIRVY